MRRIRKLIMWSVIIAFIYLLLFPISWKIEKTIAAVEVSLEDQLFYKEVDVTINGTYKWRMLGQDTFYGDISFDGYPLTSDNTLAQGKGLPTLRFDEGTVMLRYGEWMDSELFGPMHTKPFFTSFVVQVYEDTGTEGSKRWGDADGHCIVAPASNRQEALSILKKITNKYLPPYEYWLKNMEVLSQYVGNN